MALVALSNTPTSAPRPVVLFDLDGTLADTLDDVTSALNDALDAKGLLSVDRDMVRTYLGTGGTALAQAAVAMSHEAVSPGLVADVHANYLQSYHRQPVRHTRLYPGAQKMLARLESSGVALAVCTNKVASLAIPVLRTLGLDGAFKAVICGDTLEFRKPSPEPVWHALRAVGGPIADAWFVGDTAIDQQAAQAAGATFVYARYGYGVAVSSLFSISSLDELDECLADLISPSASQFE